MQGKFPGACIANRWMTTRDGGEATILWLTMESGQALSMALVMKPAVRAQLAAKYPRAFRGALAAYRREITERGFRELRLKARQEAGDVE